MSEYKKFVKDIGLVGIAQVLVSLSALILIPILTKTLGASSYGIWTQIIVTISLLTPLAMLGLPQAIIRFLASEKDKKEIQEGFFSSLIIVFFLGLAFSLLLFFSSGFLATAIFGKATAEPIIKISSFIIIIWALNQISLTFFRTFRQMGKYSIFMISQTFGEIALISYLVLSGFGLFGAVISLLIIRAIIFVIAISFIISQIGIKISPPNLSKIKPYLFFSLPIVPTFIFKWIMNSSDRYIIGYFLDSIHLGIYSAAYGIGNVIFILMAPMGLVLFPTISKLWEENRFREVKKYFTYSLKYFLMLGIPSMFGLSILSKEILMIMTKPEFVSEGYLVLSLVAVGNLFYLSTWGIWGWIFGLVKKTKFVIIILGIGSIINITLTSILVIILQLGILGAALATLVTYTIIGILTVIISCKYFMFDVDKGFIVKSIGAASTMALIIWRFSPIGLVNVLFSIVLGIGVYFGILVLLKGFTGKEIKFFKSLFR